MTSGSPAMRLHPPWDCMGESLLLAKPRPGVGLAAVGAAQNTCRWPPDLRPPDLRPRLRRAWGRPEMQNLVGFISRSHLFFS